MPALVLTTLALTGVVLVSCAQREWVPDVDTELRERAAQIHRSSIVIDGHNDVSSIWMIDDGFELAMDGDEDSDRSAWLQLMFPWLPGRPEATRIRTQTDFARIERGGLDAQFFSVWASDDFYDPDEPDRSRERAHAIIDAFEAQLQRSPDRMELTLTSDDIRRIVGEGKLAALLGIEGGHVITDDLQPLRRFYERGVRYMTLTWSFTHSWADASGFTRAPNPERRHGGLSPFGEDVVREMNDLGMLVDISHCSDETFWDTLAVTRAPIIASHFSARALSDHARNLSDDMLRGIGDNDGIVMINFIGMVIDGKRGPNRFAIDSWLHGGSPDVSVTDVVDHIGHVVAVAGIEHVGLGSDFDGSPPSFFPLGLRDVGDFPNITLELLRRGYSDEHVRMILGENLLRVLAAAERAKLDGTEELGGAT